MPSWCSICSVGGHQPLHAERKHIQQLLSPVHTTRDLALLSLDGSDYQEQQPHLLNVWNIPFVRYLNTNRAYGSPIPSTYSGLARLWMYR
jgi:hypothetical protein